MPQRVDRPAVDGAGRVQQLPPDGEVIGKLHVPQADAVGVELGAGQEVVAEAVLGLLDEVFEAAALDAERELLVGSAGVGPSF